MESIKCPGCNAGLTYDIEDKELQERPESSYAKFLHKHFPDLI